jgi:hypothetical protein
MTPPKPNRGRGSPIEVVKNYFSDLWKILAHPKLFFRHMPLKGGITHPLAFALVTHWIGSSFNFVWRLWYGNTLQRSIQNWLQMTNGTTRHFGDLESSARDKIVEWIFGVGPVVIDPFFTLVSILFTSFFVFLGARILVSPGKNGHPDEITYESAVRIICFGTAPAILSFFPFVGPFVSSFYGIVITIIGAKEAYRIGSGRAIVVALFPKFLFLGIMTTVIAMIVFAAFKLFSLAF